MRDTDGIDEYIFVPEKPKAPVETSVSPRPLFKGPLTK